MEKLVELAKEKFIKNEQQQVYFTGDDKVDIFLNDLEKHPHVFVLGCLMDRQIKAERAWKIPYDVWQIIGSKEITDWEERTEEEYIEIFTDKNLHRFPETMAKVFHQALLRIREVYEFDVSRIWSGSPSSASVVYQFLQFNGCGIKISTMAANILARDFKVPLSDHFSIDISPDVHIVRVMKRTGLVDKDANNDKIIYKARELNPEYPGIIDISCWEIGKTYCRPNNPDCENCIINNECKKRIGLK